MDIDNSINKNIFEFNNNYDKQDLQTQLELLKERLKNKEDEIIQILQKQKEEYDHLIKEKDEEISKLLDQLVLENTDLKRQIINMEIDYECLKESFDENEEKLKELEKNKVNVSETFQNTNSLIDKQFFNNLKNIEDDHNKKQKEINDKYDNLFKGLNREHRTHISNIKKLCFENKNKFVNNKIEEEELLSIPQVEDLIVQFENKVKLIYEEMKNKEKYISAIEQKYEMINEENKFLRRKVTEEKTILLKQIEDVQRERDNQHNLLVKQFEEEISSKKNNLQKQIEQGLESNEKLVLNLTKERDELRGKVDGLKKNINDVRSELTASIQEREELDALVMGRDLTIKGLNDKLETFQKDLNTLCLEKVNLIKENQELNSKLQELVGKNLNLELNQKRQTDNNTLPNNIYNKLNDNNLTGNIHYENDYNLKKKIENESLIENVKLKEIIEQLKLENQELSGKLKMLLQEKDEEKSINPFNLGYREKYQGMAKILNEDFEKLNQDINGYKQTIFELETTNKSLLIDLNTLKKSHSPAQNFIGSHKNQVKDLDRNSEKSQKFTILENANAELRRELLSNKQNISKLYENMKRLNEKYPNLKLVIRQVDDDLKMLDEIDNFCRDLIVRKNEVTAIVNTEEMQRNHKLKEENDKLSKLINDLTSEKIKNDEDIKSLKKKILYHNINLNNVYYKASETSKQSQTSLYESIIVFLKNLNMKFILDLYETKIENEDEKQKILYEKKFSNEAKNSKKYETLLIEFKDLKKECQSLFNEFDIRSKNYFTSEELSNKYSEFKTYCEEMFDFIFSTLMGHKYSEADDFILFRMPVNTFNQMIEKIHEGLEEYDKKIQLLFGEYSKMSMNIQSAVDLIVKQTKIDHDLIDKILSNPVSSKFV